MKTGKAYLVVLSVIVLFQAQGIAQTDDYECLLDEEQLTKAKIQLEVVDTVDSKRVTVIKVEMKRKEHVAKKVEHSWGGEYCFLDMQAIDCRCFQRIEKALPDEQ